MLKSLCHTMAMINMDLHQMSGTYICYQGISTGVYTYCHYSTENWYTKSDKKLEYKLYKDYIDSKYLVIPYSHGEYFGDTHAYMYSVFRAVNKLSGNFDSEWSKVSSHDLESVHIYLDDIELEPSII